MIPHTTMINTHYCPFKNARSVPSLGQSPFCPFVSLQLLSIYCLFNSVWSAMGDTPPHVFNWVLPWIWSCRDSRYRQTKQNTDRCEIAKLAWVRTAGGSSVGLKPCGGRLTWRWIDGDGYNAGKWCLTAWKRASNFPQITKAWGGFPHKFSASLLHKYVIYLQRSLGTSSLVRAQEGHRG